MPSCLYKGWRLKTRKSLFLFKTRPGDIQAGSSVAVQEKEYDKTFDAVKIIRNVYNLILKGH